MSLSYRKGLVLVLAVSSMGAGVTMAACSSGSTDAGAFGGSSGGGNPDATTGDGSVSTQPGSCANPTLQIVFSPMYSAFIPGSTMGETFSIPAVTADGNSATWSLSDPTQANLQAQSFTNDGVTTPGVMITLAGTGGSAGQVTVFATEAGGACGAAVLNITNNPESDWVIGNNRYNDGVSIHFSPPDGGGHHHDGGFAFDAGVHFGGGDGGSFFEEEGGTACTNCHGATAMSGPYKDVSHTPEQTGGFSDTDLQNIILNGQVPDGGYFDPTVINSNCDGSADCTAQAYMEWSRFHRWVDIQPDQMPGIICYLRSLAPESQTGTSNFGGGHHHDGGMPPPPGDSGGD
jgi:hypothetical protein